MERARVDVTAASRAVCTLSLLLLGSFTAIFPATASAEASDAQGRCEIQFFASSTLHDFSGKVEAKPFDLVRHLDAESGRPWWSGSVEVSVADMNTGIDRRDRNMRAMFDAVHFPHIVAQFARVENTVGSGARSGADAQLPFDLTIREVTRPIAANVSHWVEEPERASFDAEFDVSLDDFGLEVPPVLGLLRVGDIVTVRAHVALVSTPSAESAAMPPS